MITVIDTYKSRARPVDRPAIEEEVVAESLEAEFIEEVAQDSPTGLAGQVPGDDSFEDGMMTPSVVVSTEDAVVAVKELEVEGPAAAEFVEGAQALVATVEIAEPPAPYAAESEEADTDEVIASLPAAPTIRPTGVGNSWTMLEELEAKVAMLRYETQATKKKRLVSATRP
mgnify:FL=1